MKNLLKSLLEKAGLSSNVGAPVHAGDSYSNAIVYHLSCFLIASPASTSFDEFLECLSKTHFHDPRKSLRTSVHHQRSIPYY